MKNKNSCNIKTSIGGQALIEGVMMRGPKLTAMAVRNPEGEIVIEKWENVTKKKSKFWKLPVIRGVYNFIESMKFGYKCLMRSAEISGLEEAGEKAIVFHCGTKKAEGKVLTSGGRVLSVTGMGATLREAVDKAYAGVGKISFDKMFYRKDIAHRAFDRG